MDYIDDSHTEMELGCRLLSPERDGDVESRFLRPCILRTWLYFHLAYFVMFDLESRILNEVCRRWEVVFFSSYTQGDCLRSCE